jgi:chemotaxis protein CheD
VGDCLVSNRNDAELITYALGSCIAVAIWDPEVRVGGLLHYMLPDPGNAARNPAHVFRYADSGIPLLFRQAYEYGAQKKRIIVRAAGGATVIDDGGVFNIGRRNYLALKKILWQAGVLLHGEDVGGTGSRTVRLDLATGRFWIRGAGEAEFELRGAKEECVSCLVS